MSLGDSGWVWWCLGSLGLSLMGETVIQLPWTVCSVVVPDFRWLWRKPVARARRAQNYINELFVPCCLGSWGWKGLEFLPGFLLHQATSTSPSKRRCNSSWKSFAVGVMAQDWKISECLNLSDTSCCSPTYHSISYWLLDALCVAEPAPNDMVKEELDMSCFFAKFSCVLSLVLAGLIAVINISTTLWKTRVILLPGLSAMLQVYWKKTPVFRDPVLFPTPSLNVSWWKHLSAGGTGTGLQVCGGPLIIIWW